MLSSKVKRTYGSRSQVERAAIPASPPELTSSLPSLKRKRAFLEQLSIPNIHPAKKPRGATLASSKLRKNNTQDFARKSKQTQLTQLHFSIDTSVLKTCPKCDLTYTHGAPDDESLHRAHCARVQRGLEWGREEEREMGKSEVEELATGVKLKNGSRGRIVCFRSDVGGRIGSKLATLLDTISLALSAPPLSPSVLQTCKVYLFLLPSSTSTAAFSREKIVGCVIAQRISTAMVIATDAELAATSPSQASDDFPPVFLPVDSASNLYVHPAPLPTPLGIPRLFVSSSHRRLGIASQLLSIAASTFILGCPLDPSKGEVAFTQPTGAGKGVLEVWGKGGVRIYEEEHDR